MVTVPLFDLTFDHQKLRLYPMDLEIRLVWEALHRRLGAENYAFACEHTLLLIKPESFRRRFAEPIIQFLEEAGFLITSAKFVSLSGVEERFVWRYQWNKSTSDRQKLSQIKNQHDRSVLLCLRNTVEDEGLPASVRLHELKGSSAFMDQRRPHHLRSLLGSSDKGVTYVHCPDEPADFLRETSVFFADGDEILHAFGPTQWSGLSRREVLQFEQSLEPHSIDYEEVKSRHERSSAGALPRFFSAEADMQEWTLDDIQPFFGDLADPVTRWDFITCAARHIRYDREHEQALISTKVMPRVVELWKHFDYRNRLTERRQVQGNSGRTG